MGLYREADTILLLPMPRTPARTPADPIVTRDAILAAVRGIPRGTVSSYGRVARRAGLPGRARLVARILASNDDPTLPWHRVLRSDGRIAFAVGSDDFQRQLRRLEGEGVTVSNGRVRNAGDGDAHPDLSLDALLWGPPA